MRLLNFGVQSVTAFCITMSPGLGETERQGGGRVLPVSKPVGRLSHGIPVLFV